jgi:Flp pilus assembly protein TadD
MKTQAVKRIVAIMAGALLLNIFCAYAETAQEDYDQGVKWLDTGVGQDAVDSFTKAIALKPDYLDAYYNRGVAYCMLLVDFEKAIADFTVVIKADPKNAKAYNERGLAYSCTGGSALALADYNKAIEVDPNYPKSYTNRAISYAARKDYDKSWQDVNKAISLGCRVTDDSVEKDECWIGKTFVDRLKKISGRDK